MYHSETATALKQATDKAKETLEDTERAQTAAGEKLKEVERDMNQTKQQITDVSIYSFKIPMRPLNIISVFFFFLTKCVSTGAIKN